MFLNSNLVTPENFNSVPPFKSYSWFSLTQNKLHTKRITPLPYMGTGGNFFIPHFFYLSQNGVSLLHSLTPFCLDKSFAFTSNSNFLTQFNFILLFIFADFWRANQCGWQRSGLVLFPHLWRSLQWNSKRLRLLRKRLQGSRWSTVFCRRKHR